MNLNQPYRVLNLFADVIKLRKDKSSVLGSKAIEKVVQELNDEDVSYPFPFSPPLFTKTKRRLPAPKTPHVRPRLEHQLQTRLNSPICPSRRPRTFLN